MLIKHKNLQNKADCKIYVFLPSEDQDVRRNNITTMSFSGLFLFSKAWQLQTNFNATLMLILQS